MKIRPAKREDFEELLRLNKLHNFPFPEFDNILSIQVVEDLKGKIVAWGYLRKYVEAVFIPDVTRQKRDIIESWKLINEVSISESNRLGIDQIHVFVTKDSFTDLLIRKFHYEPCTGKALVLNIDNGQERPERRSE